MKKNTIKQKPFPIVVAWICFLGFLIISCSGADEISDAPINPGQDTTPTEFNWQIAKEIDKVRFDHLGVEDGISANETTAVIQDQLGYLWFGTKSGLNQYDGRNFTIYKHDHYDTNSLSDNWILSLHEDQDGIIWIGTLNGGLDRYDPEFNTFTNFTHDPENPESLSHNQVITIYEDSDRRFISRRFA